MTNNRKVAVTLAALTAVGTLSFGSCAAFAGFDEAHMYSFMDGSDAAPAAPPTTEARGHNSYEGARAYYDGSASPVHHRVHHYRVQQ